MQGGAGRKQLLGSIQVAYCRSFVHLVELYSDFLLVTFDWKSLPQQASVMSNTPHFSAAIMCWLCSIANDAYVLRTDTLSSYLSYTEGNEHARVLETKLCALSTTAVDVLSCFVFGQLAFSSFKMPFQNIHKVWRVDDLMENIVSEMGLSLAHCASFLENECFLNLMRLILLKLSVWYIFFLKEMSSSATTLTPSDCEHIRQDVRIVFEFITEGPVDLTEALQQDLRIFELIESLFTGSVENDSFLHTAQGLSSEVKKVPALAPAVTSLLSSVMKLRRAAAKGKETFVFTQKLIIEMRDFSKMGMSLPLSVIKAKHYHLYAVLIVFGGKASQSKGFLNQFLSSSLQSNTDFASTLEASKEDSPAVSRHVHSHRHSPSPPVHAPAARFLTVSRIAVEGVS